MPEIKQCPYWLLVLYLPRVGHQYTISLLCNFLCPLSTAPAFPYVFGTLLLYNFSEIGNSQIVKVLATIADCEQGKDFGLYHIVTSSVAC